MDSPTLEPFPDSKSATKLLKDSKESKEKKNPKRKGKKQSKEGIQDKKELDDFMLLIENHPHVVFIHKRMRSYKKKLEKIKSLEQGTKRLNEQQVELVQSKHVIEKMLNELLAVKEQFILSYTDELAASKNEQEKKDPDKGENEEKDLKNERKERKYMSEQCESPCFIKEEGKQVTDEFYHVETLLKSLHLVHFYHLNGKELPKVLDYFTKVVLGTTRPFAELNYMDNFMESMAEATRFLCESEKIFACDTSYKYLRQMVDQLTLAFSSLTTTQEESFNIVEKEQKKDQQGENENEKNRVEEVVVPTINFFTESQLEKDEPEKHKENDKENDNKEKKNRVAKRCLSYFRRVGIDRERKRKRKSR